MASSAPLLPPRLLAVGLGFVALLCGRAPAAPAAEVIPPSGLKFESLKLRPIPPYRAAQDEKGASAVLTRHEITQQLRLITGLALNERGEDLLPPALPRISCRYERYSPVSDEWFGELTGWYHQELHHLGLDYHKDSWDCDDFSLALNAFADLALLLNREHLPPQLIGRLVVRQVHPWAGTPAGGVHELVIFCSGSAWQVYEPQTNTIGSFWDYPNRTFIREVLFN